MTTIQIILLCVCVVGFLMTMIRGRRRDVKPLLTLAYAFFWLATALIVAYPSLATRIAEKVGVGRGADLVLYVGMMLIFLILFRIFLRIEAMEATITKLVQHIALKK